jgi:topoisomerase-4 subunit A
MTVTISKNGWVRAAKGHEIDPETLTYKAGDSFLSAARGKSNQQAVFLDSTGRTYSTPLLNLPSARGHGEPLTGRFNLQPQADFKAVLSGEPGRLILMASDAGYGFVTELQNLYTKNQKGKALLSLPQGAEPLHPLYVENPEGQLLAALTNEARMLVFPLKILPQLPRGKGNKIIQIPPARARDGVELLTRLTLIPEGGTMTIFSGKRHFKLTFGNLQQFMGERGRRGKKLPRGFRNVSRIETELSEQARLVEVVKKDLFE